MKYIRYGKIYDTDKIEKVFKLEKLEIQKEDPNNNQIKFRTSTDSSNNSSLGMVWGTATSSFVYPNTDSYATTKPDNYVYERFIGKTPNDNYVRILSTSVKDSNGNNIHVEDKIYYFFEDKYEVIRELSQYYGFSDSYNVKIEEFIRQELKAELPEA